MRSTWSSASSRRAARTRPSGKVDELTLGEGEAGRLRTSINTADVASRWTATSRGRRIGTHAICQAIYKSVHGAEKVHNLYYQFVELT